MAKRVVLFAAALTGVGVAGCKTTDSIVGSEFGAAPGQACEIQGAVSAATDGCNTCTCTQGHWTCSTHACEQLCTSGAAELSPDGCNSCVCDDTGQWLCTQTTCNECQSGEHRPVGDGCNVCTCIAGQWSCTTDQCRACPLPRDPEGEDCASVEAVAMDPATGSCCRYAAACRVPHEMMMVDDESSCWIGDAGSGGAAGMHPDESAMAMAGAAAAEADHGMTGAMQHMGAGGSGM